MQKNPVDEYEEENEDEEKDSSNDNEDDLSESSEQNSPPNSPKLRTKCPSESPKPVSEPPQIKKSVLKSTSQYSKNDKQSFKLTYFIPSTILLILALVLFYLSANTSAINSTKIIDKEELINNFKNNIADLSIKFKRQDSGIWNDIKASVIDVIENSMRPSIIILQSNQDDPMNCLANMIANASKAALNSEKALWLTPEDIGSNQGVVLERYKEEIQKYPVVIIENILNIHPDAIQAFHYFCDGEDSLVGRAIFIFTMKTSNQRKSKQLTHFIQDQLFSKFKDSIDDYKLFPLIARISDATIIPVQAEPDIISCPLRY